MEYKSPSELIKKVNESLKELDQRYESMKPQERRDFMKKEIEIPLSLLKYPPGEYIQ